MKKRRKEEESRGRSNTITGPPNSHMSEDGRIPIGVREASLRLEVEESREEGRVRLLEATDHGEKRQQQQQQHRRPRLKASSSMSGANMRGPSVYAVAYSRVASAPTGDGTNPTEGSNECQV